MTDAATQISYDFQSEARLWIELPDVDTSHGKGVTLKLKVSELAELYRVCDEALRDYSAQTSDVLSVVPDEPLEPRP